MKGMNSNSAFWNCLEQVQFLFSLPDFQVFEDIYYDSFRFSTINLF